MTEDISPISPPLSERLQRQVDLLENAIRAHRDASVQSIDKTYQESHLDDPHEVILEDILEGYERANETLWNIIGADND
jgi:hypothetical protein